MIENKFQSLNEIPTNRTSHLVLPFLNRMNILYFGCVNRKKRKVLPNWNEEHGILIHDQSRIVVEGVFAVYNPRWIQTESSTCTPGVLQQRAIKSGFSYFKPYPYIIILFPIFHANGLSVLNPNFFSESVLNTQYFLWLVFDKYPWAGANSELVNVRPNSDGN